MLPKLTLNLGIQLVMDVERVARKCDGSISPSLTQGLKIIKVSGSAERSVEAERL